MKIFYSNSKHLNLQGRDIANVKQSLSCRRNKLFGTDAWRLNYKWEMALSQYIRILIGQYYFLIFDTNFNFSFHYIENEQHGTV